MKIIKEEVTKVKRLAKEEIGEARGILGRLKRRDLKGNSGQAIKNSTYQIIITIASKVGSLLFTIILARMLLPELFGLYSLTMATLLALCIFSDLGLSTSVLNFISKFLANNNLKKAKVYFNYITKIKLFFLCITFLFIISTSYFISYNFYNKPIFLALIAGSFYMIFMVSTDYLKSILMANNNFRPIVIREIFLQVLRLVLIPIVLLITIKYTNDPKIIIAWIFAALSLIHLIILIYTYKIVYATQKYLKEKSRKISKSEKNNFKKFAIPLGFMVLSGFFFNYIDVLMLGHFVSAGFIAFYSAALNLAGSLLSVLAFASVAVFPIFTKLKGRRLNGAFRKTRNITALISIAGALFVFIFAELIVKIVYGADYSPAINILKIISILVLIEPVSGLYGVYYMSVGKTKNLAMILIFASILNIILNYVLITAGLKVGMINAVYGAVFATIISRSVYVALLGIFRKR